MKVEIKEVKSYQVTYNDGEIYRQVESKEEAEKIKSELETRRTGRTTRMLFAALASGTNCMIVAPRRPIARSLFANFMNMLSRLEFDFVSNTNEYSVVTNGLRYDFITVSALDSTGFRLDDETIILKDHTCDEFPLDNGTKIG